jgi:hypothetical protein
MNNYVSELSICLASNSFVSDMEIGEAGNSKFINPQFVNVA